MATFSDDFAQTCLNAGWDLMDGGTLKFYSAGDVLGVTLTFGSPAFAAPSGRSVVANAIASVAAIANIVCTYAKCAKADTTLEVTVTVGGSAIITAVDTGANTLTLNDATLYAVNDPIKLFMDGAGALPTGIVEGDTYYVKTKVGSDITISTSVGGATLDITGAGSGTQRLKAAATELALGTYDGSMTIGQSVSVVNFTSTFPS